MKPVAILSPGYPTSLGGVTDHTTRIVNNWEASGFDVVVVGGCEDDPKHVVTKLAAASAHAILIQYVPFLYGRRGLSRFPRQIAVAARKHGMRVTTFVHEPWVPANRPKWLILSPLQKRQLKRLLAVSNTTVTAVPSWQKQLGDNTKLIYVSCVQPPIEAAETAKPTLESPVVFSPFASGLNWEWISRAERELNSGSGLTIIGADKTAVCQHPLVRQFYRANWDCRGRVTGDEVLRLLSRSRLVLAPFIDGVTGRRTSIAAALSVGARVLSSKGHLFDSTFDGTVSTADSLDDFITRSRQLWSTPPSTSERAERLRWFRTNLDPVTLDSQLYQEVFGSDS